MIVLRKESPILYAEINNLTTGFYEEVLLEEAPKDVQAYIKNGGKTGGCGVSFSEDYVWSNTNGITHGKVFKKVGEGLRFEPICHQQCVNLRQTQSMNELATLLPAETLFKVSYDHNTFHDILTISAEYVFPKEDLICEDQSWRSDYKELFRGRHKYSVNVYGTKEGVSFQTFKEKGWESPFHQMMTLSQLKQHLTELGVVENRINYWESENKYYRPTGY